MEREEEKEEKKGETRETDEPLSKRGKMTVEEGSEEGPSVSTEFVSYDPSTMTIDRKSLPSILGMTGNPTALLVQIHRLSVDPPERFVQIPHPLETAIKKSMKDAYWKILDQDFEKTPPVYDTAISLVHEIKEMLLNGLLRDEKRRNEVTARLDINTLRNQVEQGELDVPSIGSFILTIFTSICAPHRDPEISQIRSNMENVPILLRNLMEMTDKIKEDVVSFKLEMRREEVLKAAREYEKHDLEKSFTVVNGAKEKLQTWIRKVYEMTTEQGDCMEKVEEIVSRVVRRGFIRNLSFSSISDIPFFWRLDLNELKQLSLQRLRIVLVAASVYLLNSIRPLSPSSQSSLIPRLCDLSNDLSDENITSILESLHIECRNVLKELNELHEESEDKLKVIGRLIEKDQPLRALAEKRLDEYVLTLLNTSTSPLPPPPSPLTPLASLFPPLLSTFLKYINHHEKTFHELYLDTLSSVISSSSSS